MEQIDTMDTIEREINKLLKDPSDIDFERYYFYVEKGTDSSMIAPLSDNQFSMFYSMVPEDLIKVAKTPNEVMGDDYTSLALVPKHMKFSLRMNDIHEQLRTEITNDHMYAMRKSIVDYILMSYEERERLKIQWVPKPFNLK